MPQGSAERMAQLVAQLREQPAIAGQLPHEIGALVQEALDGASVHEIAQSHGISTEAVWNMLGTAAQAASGQGPARRVETGGLGSDTDPGVTGGYGDTGFGALGNEPPVSIPEEPIEPDQLEAWRAAARREGE